MAPTSNASPARGLHRRTVFYLSGFDPRGAAHYHALYRNEAAKQSRLSGLILTVGPRHKTERGNSCWHITAQTPAGPVETRYEFLRWDDVVRKNWSRNPARLAWDILATTWLNLRQGALLQMLTLSWVSAVALLAPVVLLGVVLAGSTGLSAWLFFLTRAESGIWGAAAMAVATAGAWLQVGLWLEKRYSMLWLMRSYAFNARQARGRVPELEVRLDEHAKILCDRISAAEDDEIQIVGHSSGTILAATVLARALRQKPWSARQCPVISLLTLGQCMPMQGCLPDAKGFRDDLKLLAGSQNIDWLDFSAPSDGCCFALVDPVTGCGIRHAAGIANKPKLLSPRFAAMFEPAAYSRIRRDKFRVHFQYLMASDLPVRYDYFAMTAGSMTLAERFRLDSSITDYGQFRLFKSMKINRS